MNEIQRYAVMVRRVTCLFSGMLSLCAQTGVQWERTFGGADEDVALVVEPVADGGFLLGGYSYSDPSGAKADASHDAGDYWVVKVDASGNQQWDKSFGGARFDGLRSMQQTSDGGYVLGGTSFSGPTGNKTSTSFGPHSGDYWIVKLNAAGNKQWEKVFGGTNLDTLAAVQQTDDGGYILAGTSSSPASGNKTSESHGAGASDWWVVKTDPNGGKQWERSFGGDDDDELHAVASTTDGGFVFAGTSFSAVSGNKGAACHGLGDFWVVKVDANGHRLWEKTFGGDDAEELFSVCVAADGGILLGGHSASGTSGNKSAANFGAHDFWLVRLDAGGNKQWDKTYGGDDSDELFVVHATAGGGYVLGGMSSSAASGSKTTAKLSADSADYWIIHVDAQGSQRHEQAIRGNLSGEALRLRLGSDGGMVVPGLGSGHSDQDFALTRMAGPLRFVTSAFGPGQVFQAQVTATDGSSYILQASTNLVAWTALATNRATNGHVTFAYTNPPAARRFFRVQQQP